MKRIAIHGVAAVLVVGIALVGLVTTASASHVVASITAPSELLVGQVTNVQVALDVDGKPVANTLVTLYTDASFADVVGEVEVGSATTDANGVALIEYEPRHASVHELRVEYTAPGESEPTVTNTQISVAGAEQLHLSAAGIQVPGLNVWLIIAVVSGVWFLLASVGWRVFAIARASSGTYAARS